MPNNYILKDFDGGAQKSTLTAAINNSATSFSLVDGSTFPAGSNPFVVVIDRGLATEEKILISGRITNSFNVLERAYDGSSAQSHALGAVVEHVLDAYTIEQANRYVNLQTTKGDLVSHDGTTAQRLAVGANQTVLIADTAQASGVKWGQIEANSISSGAISAIAAQVETLISPSGVPAGIITQFAGSTPPSGWFLCNGDPKNTTSESALFAAIGYTYGGSGSTFNLPNLKGRVPVGRDSSQGEFDNLGETGGVKEVALDIAQMPLHNHSVGTLTVPSSGSHVHTHDAPSPGIDGILTRSSLGMSGSVTTTGGGQEFGVGTISSGGDHPHTITGSTANQGSGSVHTNLQPYIVVNYIIKA
jgi:microcystin-dependent protein